MSDKRPHPFLGIQWRLVESREHKFVSQWKIPRKLFQRSKAYCLLKNMN